MDPVNESPRVLGNRYEVGEILGRGGMAEVHLGRDSRLGRTVAIKMLRNDLARDPTFQARFRREAQSAAGLNHPAIVAVYDTGEDKVAEAGGGTLSLPYIVMEFVEGRTLREMLNEDGQPLATNIALEVTSGVLSALEYSHRAGIVHRDIKPANVMLTKRGEIKVMDFGIARAVADVSATMTQTHAVIGTAQYLSPEQARGETVDARSDLYSAGCMLYELLTGRPPFVADSPVAVAYQHVREVPQPPSTFNPRIPQAVDRVVLHALAKDREARYQSAQAFRADVDAARTGGRVSAAVMAGADQTATTATEYYPHAAAGTRAMAPVGQGMHPGHPTTQHRRSGQPGEYPYPTRASARNAAAPQSSRKNGILVAALLIAFALISYAVYSTVNPGDDSTANQVMVPDVVNLAQQEAIASLDGKDLKHSVTAQASNSVSKGKVISQTPIKDTAVDPGSSVALVISTGPSSVEVPDLAGKSQSEARDALKRKGLEFGDVVTVQSSSYDSGQVVRTEPKAGATAAPGDVVTVYISTGMVKVPDLVGRTEEEAKNELDKLDLSFIVEKENSDQPAGTVIAQEPKGTVVEQNARITITISEGPIPTSPGPTESISLDPRESNGWPIDTGSVPGEKPNH
jgi:eukaryotic-like serine/threonine-protein kinase